jgi:hypothetical protein
MERRLELTTSMKAAGRRILVLVVLHLNLTLDPDQCLELQALFQTGKVVVRLMDLKRSLLHSLFKLPKLIRNLFKLHKLLHSRLPRLLASPSCLHQM